MTALHSIPLTLIDGTETDFGRFKGEVVLVVNVASQCGFTPQYAGLEALHNKFRGQGFQVLGVPCNQFAGQEPGTEAEIQTFCSTRYDVTFPLFSKIEVNGAGRDPLYAFLTSQPTEPDGAGDIQWNFAKFLVGKSGEVLARFSPTEAPTSDEVVKAIETAL